MRFRIPRFARISEPEKVRIDRRAFLRGMTVTAAGLMVPRAVVFDEGRVVKPDGLRPLPASLLLFWVHQVGVQVGVIPRRGAVPRIHKII